MCMLFEICEKRPFQKSIAFGSAPRREVDSQPFSPCARPAVSHTVSGRCVPKQWSDASLQTAQWPNGNAADRSLFGRRFEPWLAAFGAAAAAKSQQTRVRTTDRKLCVGCVTIRPAVV